MHSSFPAYCRALVAVPLFVLNLTASENEAPKSPPDKSETVLDFSADAQMELLRGANYSRRDEAGVGGTPGVLLSGNVGPQDESLYFAREPFDLRRQTVTLSVLFKTDGINGPGAARVFLGFGDRADTNLAVSDGKIGVRVFKGDKPKYPDSPWILQLINAVATREIGKQFVLQEGHWYRLSLTLGMGEDQTQFVFDTEIRDFGADGRTPGEFVRKDSGATQVLGNYDAREMFAGLLGQRNNGGAVAFDDFQIAGSGGMENLEPLHPVTFVPAPMPDRKAPANTIFGVCGHFMHTPLFYPDSDKSPYWQPAFTLPFLLEGGFGWVREPVYQPWFEDVSNPRAVANRQRVEEYLALYQKHGVKVMLVPMTFPPGTAKHDPFREPYFEWLGELAAKFDCVKVIEMHNEPNLKFFWGGTAKQYVEVYRRGAEIIRAKAPRVEIAIGSISSLWWKPGIDWLKAVLDEGALEWAGAVTAHPYNGKRPPETDPNFEGGSPDAHDHLDRAIKAFGELLASKAPNGGKPGFYFTELGYSAAKDGIFAIGDENLQADYLSRLMLIYFASRVRGVPLKAVFWYDLKNDGSSGHMEANFGLVDFDTSRVKPAYDAYRRIAWFFKEPDDFQELSLETVSSNWDDSVKRHVWKRSDGVLIVPVWRLPQRQPKPGDFATVLSVELPEGFRPGRVVWHDLSEQAPRPVGFSVEEGRLAVPLRLTQRAAWLEVFPAED